MTKSIDDCGIRTLVYCEWGIPIAVDEHMSKVPLYDKTGDMINQHNNMGRVKKPLGNSSSANIVAPNPMKERGSINLNNFPQLGHSPITVPPTSKIKPDEWIGVVQ